MIGHCRLAGLDGLGLVVAEDVSSNRSALQAEASSGQDADNDEPCASRAENRPLVRSRQGEHAAAPGPNRLVWADAAPCVERPRHTRADPDASIARRARGLFLARDENVLWPNSRCRSIADRVLSLPVRSVRVVSPAWLCLPVALVTATKPSLSRTPRRCPTPRQHHTVRTWGAEDVRQDVPEDVRALSSDFAGHRATLAGCRVSVRHGSSWWACWRCVRIHCTPVRDKPCLEGMVAISSRESMRSHGVEVVALPRLAISGQWNRE